MTKKKRVIVSLDDQVYSKLNDLLIAYYYDGRIPLPSKSEIISDAIDFLFDKFKL